MQYKSFIWFFFLYESNEVSILNMTLWGISNLWPYNIANFSRHFDMLKHALAHSWYFAWFCMQFILQSLSECPDYRFVDQMPQKVWKNLYLIYQSWSIKIASQLILFLNNCHRKNRDVSLSSMHCDILICCQLCKNLFPKSSALCFQVKTNQTVITV